MNNYLLTLDAIACAVIAVRLFAYRSRGATYRPIASFFAYALMVASASVTIRILTGDYHQADWSETLINISMAVAIVVAGGNVMRFSKPARLKP
ncbi:phage holin family protein [Yersinia mollaretii]|uniref:phage holin family protein n=1 Tax=Yersinia mollaretii TaxID=33060 RepID=UPI000C150045|nr:phage holin family protein [Yersinia mollaretii]MDA5526260.1 phage holin family protein [Yersinia mollaretii]MDR7873149.1 phage holin family protein [Yersinia mollaretii]PHZ32936.1 holin [Yersinia mollaretii]WQC76255.1 phage holin family protein [Yersinia mollaretii]